MGFSSTTANPETAIQFLIDKYEEPKTDQHHHVVWEIQVDPGMYGDISVMFCGKLKSTHRCYGVLRWTWFYIDMVMAV